jgi:hypothetical protein
MPAAPDFVVARDLAHLPRSTAACATSQCGDREFERLRKQKAEDVRYLTLDRLLVKLMVPPIHRRDRSSMIEF